MKIFMERKYRWIRPTVFFIYASSFIVPIIHRFIIKDKNDNAYYIELEYFLISALMYILGIILYITRYPEKCSKGTFDIFGSSHQLFHIFVLLGGALSLVGVIKAIIGDNNITC
jgi:adiponectin receptor